MGKDGNAKKILEQCRFGVTVIENVYASDDNPLKRGIYVRTKRIRAAMNSGIFLELTDGDGEFWTTPIEAVKIVSSQLAERDAEIARLRQQVAELEAWKDAVQSIAQQRMIPQNDNRSPINIEPGVKERLHSYLMEQAPSGEGYSEFIARALAWREMID